MHIGTISTRPVETCTGDCSALALAERMRHAHVGDIVVVEYRNGEPVPIGLVTDRDLVVAVMASGEDPDQFTAGQIMSRGLIVVSETDEISVALDEMRRSGIRRLPVVDDSGRLTGIVTPTISWTTLPRCLVESQKSANCKESKNSAFARSAACGTHA